MLLCVCVFPPCHLFLFIIESQDNSREKDYEKRIKMFSRTTLRQLYYRNERIIFIPHFLVNVSSSKTDCDTLCTLCRLLEYTHHLVTSVGESICNHGGHDGDLCVYIRTVHAPRAVFTRKSIVFLGKVTISAYRFPATGYYRTVRERRSRSGAPK